MRFASSSSHRAALIGAALAACAAVHAQAVDADTPGLAVPSSHDRLGFERVRFAGDGGPRVGLVGTSYLVDVAGNSGISVGPAVYGAISGRHGGFFTLGGEAAWRQRLVGPLGVELGLFAGGGGGGGTQPGTGLMLRPHADVVWDLGPVALGLSLSKVRYSNGQIDSNQIGPDAERQQRLPLRAGVAPRRGDDRRRPCRARLRSHRVHRRRLPNTGRQAAHRRHAAAAHVQPRRRACRAIVRGQRVLGHRCESGSARWRRRLRRIPRHRRPRRRSDPQRAHRRWPRRCRHGRRRQRLDRRRTARQGGALRHRAAHARRRPRARRRLCARAERQLPCGAGIGGSRLGARRARQQRRRGTALAHGVQRRGRAIRRPAQATARRAISAR